MGLEEKRAMKQVMEEWLLPKFDTINDIFGRTVVVEVDQASFENKDDIVMLPNAGFDRMIEAFQTVASDDLGKEALQSSVKKIVMKCVKSPSDVKLDLSGGVLTYGGLWGHSEGFLSSYDISTQLMKMVG